MPLLAFLTPLAALARLAGFAWLRTASAATSVWLDPLGRAVALGALLLIGAGAAREHWLAEGEARAASAAQLALARAEAGAARARADIEAASASARDADRAALAALETQLKEARDAAARAPNPHCNAELFGPDDKWLRKKRGDARRR